MPCLQYAEKAGKKNILERFHPISYNEVLVLKKLCAKCLCGPLYWVLNSALCCEAGTLQLESFLSFETGFHYVAWAGVELRILLPLPPKSWDL
jgi:hypothetical protein